MTIKNVGYKIAINKAMNQAINITHEWESRYLIKVSKTCECHFHDNAIT